MLIRSNLDFGGIARVIGLLDGVNPQDAATVAQLASAVEGLAWKDSVRVAAPANINVASPGATVDGIAMVAGDRVLLPNQTAGAENGIYIWNGAAVAMTRALDMNSAAEVEQAITTVEEGTSAGASFRQTAVNVTLGTTTLTWAAFGTGASPASTTTAGVIEIATQAEVDAGSAGSLAVTAALLAAWASRPRIKSGNIGDGAATQIDVTHNWNTRDVIVQLWQAATPWAQVIADVSFPDANTVRFNFASAPASAAYHYVLHTGGTA
jgi:hypothetical protein